MELKQALGNTWYLEDWQRIPLYRTDEHHCICLLYTSSLRMSSEQKYKEGDGPYLQWDASNRDELLVLTDRQPCYKTRLSDFDPKMCIRDRTRASPWAWPPTSAASTWGRCATPPSPGSRIPAPT